MRGQWFVLALLWLAPAMAQEAMDAPLLDDIRFVGNEVTRQEVLRQELTVHEGQPVTPAQIEKSRRALMNMGLFKSVQAELLNEQGKNILQITVAERFYILPLPSLDYRPDFLADEVSTNYTYGGEMRFDNLFGLNQRLRISYEEKKYVDNVEPLSRKMNLFYAYPRIVGTPYRLEVTGERRERNINVYASNVLLATVAEKSQNGSFFLSRWLNPSGVSEGWYAGGGLKASSIYYSENADAVGYSDTQVIALLGRFGYHRVDEFPYHRDGDEFSYLMELAQPAWSSDMTYIRNTFTYRHYRPLQSVDANFNSQLKLGLAFGDGQAYSLGGSTFLRGYDTDILQGNLLLQGNFEYQHHITGYRQMRGVIFLDVANVWPEVATIDSYRLYSGLGVGMRWRVQSFVDVTLSLDYAYNTDNGETKTYLGTSGSF